MVSIEWIQITDDTSDYLLYVCNISADEVHE